MAELTYEAAFPSRFIKAALLNGKQVTMTLANVYMEVLEGESGKENKLIASFKERPMELVLCKSNAFCLREMWGSKVKEWVGKRVTLYPTKVAFGPKQVDAIRIFGSPDIDADIELSARIGRKQFKATMHKVAAKGAAPAEPAAPEPENVDADAPFDYEYTPNA